MPEILSVPHMLPSPSLPETLSPLLFTPVSLVSYVYTYYRHMNMAISSEYRQSWKIRIRRQLNALNVTDRFVAQRCHTGLCLP